MDVSTALVATKQVDDALGVLGKLLAKLKAKPDLAAQKLAQALEEIAKTYQMLEGAISSYLSLGIDQGVLEKNSKALLDIEGGALSTAVERGRGHCHVIGNIYHQYLDRWFRRILKHEEHESIRRVFERLANADDDVFRHLAKAASELESEAHEVLNLVIRGNVSGARHRVLRARDELTPLRLRISKTMQKLYRLKGQFIEISRVA